MSRRITWRAILIVAFLLLSAAFLMPTLSKGLPTWWKGPFLPQDKITLGLDLQGGTHLVMEVDVDKAVEASLDLVATDLARTFSDQNFRYKNVERVGNDLVAATFYDRETADKASDPMKKKYVGYELLPAVEESGYITLQLRITPQEAQNKRTQAVQQALETIRNRVDQFGLAEPVIQQEGTRNIVVQLPGIEDPQRAIELIGKTARLDFKLVDHSVDASTATPGNIPADDELLYEKRVDPRTGLVSTSPVVVKKRAMMTGDLLTDARSEVDQKDNKAYVAIEFNSLGAKLFDEITAANVNKRFAIILDNTVYSSPVIQERISGGNARISGSFTLKEAGDLAIILRSGSLPAPVKIVQNVTVGPSLGQDSIHKGLIAGLVGIGLVVVFMLFYYRLSGLVANFGMLLNVIYLMGGLALFGATLTLPGIAAIVLLIGMSVDSNVLIFERVREELRLGKTPKAAIDAGYDRAFLTIMDSHITTLITAFVLFIFGTGPVKGFAVSLSLGVIINLFTSLVGTKEVFDFFLSRRAVKKLSI